MTATVQQLEYNYQATCDTCHWQTIPTLMKHRAQDAADTHNALWHDAQECAA